MLKLDWGNPKISIPEFETYLTNYLGDQYDGLLQNGTYLYVVTYSPLSPDQEDHITDYVSSLNQIPKEVNISSQPAITVSALPPFGAKTINVNGVVKKLYARSTGIQQVLTAGSNTITYTLTYPWAKILGVEIINCEALDYADFKVLDSTAGTYTGVPNYTLNQFAFSNNLPKDFYIRTATFDADMYQGMQIQFTYNSVSAKTLGINFLIYEVKS